MTEPSAPIRCSSPRFERPQKLGLSLGAEVADLVEEESPSVRELEPAQPALGCAGERAFLVSEHLRLDQIARNRGTVHRHVRTIRPPAGSVDRRRHELLAGSRLAGDENACLGRGHARNQFSHLPHRNAVADQRSSPRELGLKRAILGAGSVELERRPHRHQHRLGRERLLEELKRAELDGAHGVVELCFAAHHDDRRRAALFPQPDQRLEAIGARRHEQVEQNHIGVDVFDHQEGGVAVCCFRHRHPLLAEERAEHATDVYLIVHEENLGRHSAQSPCNRTKKVAPPPGVSATSIVPACMVTVCLAKARPSPVPPLLAVAYGSKILPRIPTGMPGP